MKIRNLANGGVAEADPALAGELIASGTWVSAEEPAPKPKPKAKTKPAATPAPEDESPAE